MAEPITNQRDLYGYHVDDVKEPPTTLAGALQQVGPGILLTASIVGTGELIATTTLGAEIGYVMLWAVILSCLIKVVVQAMMGRYSIATGETTLESFQRFPGPRFAGANWIVWLWAAIVFFVLLQVGAMFSGVAQVMNILLPSIPVDVWVFILGIITLWVLLAGSYDKVEVFATWMVAIFTLMTVVSVYVLINKPQFFSWAEVTSGLKFAFPDAGIATAVAVFGITGVGATELVAYPYWCVEKGYARYAGKPEDSEAWRNRARGWIKVMHTDILAAMLIYTFATVAFYLLGAGILNKMGLVPKGNEMIKTLSNMYSETMGPFGFYLFLIGAIAVLYSTIFAATAAHARLYPDMLQIIGVFKRNDYTSRVKWVKIFTVILIVVPVIMHYTFKAPVAMVKAGGIAQSLLLPVIALSTILLIGKHLEHRLKPQGWVMPTLWVILVIMVVAAYFGIKKILGL
jgi:manganese transport protein